MNAPAPREPARRWLLVALMLTMMLAAMDTTIVSTAIPQIVADLGGFALFAWVFSIYLLTQTISIPVYGKLADLYGRKPVLIIGTLIFLTGSAASAAAWNMETLVLFRGLQGLGAGSIMATVNTLAGDLYSVRERARIQGWLSSVWGISAIAGPTLGGALAQYASWRWIFLINLPIGAAALTLIGLYLHEKVERQRHHIDVAGTLLVLATVGLLIFGLLQGGQAWPWLSPTSLAVFAAALVLAGLTALVEAHSPEPVMPGWLWRRRELACANLAMIGMGFVMMAPIAFLPTFAQSVLGLGPIAAGLVLACMSIGWPLASSLSGHAYMRIGFRDTGLIGGLLIVAGGGLFLSLPYTDSGPTWLVVIDQIMLGAGFGLLSTPLLVGIQNSVGWSQRGMVTGANMFSRYLGQSLGAAVFGAIFNAALARRISDAPANLHGQLPSDVNDIINSLHTPGLLATGRHYLQQAIYAATHDIYLGLTLGGVLILLTLAACPRVFTTAPNHRGAT